MTGPPVEYVLTTPADQAFLPSRPEDITFSRPKNSFAKCAARTVGSTFLNGTSVSVTASTCASRARITRMKPRAVRYKIFRPGGLMTAGCAVTWIPEDNKAPGIHVPGQRRGVGNAPLEVDLKGASSARALQV